MVYKALVADDEYIIRRGIISFLKKYDNIEVVGEAEDGELALKCAKETRPDIYFVDVNMPFLNGLEFVEALKEIQENAVVVIITGYDSFEYARKALRLGVNDYILKPLMEDVFDKAVNKVTEKLEGEQKERRELTWARKMLFESRGKLVQEFLIKWAEGYCCLDEILEKLEYLELEIPLPYMVTMLHLEQIESEKPEGQWKEELLYYAAENIMKEIYENPMPTYTFSFGGRLVLISGLTNEQEPDNRKEDCRRYIEKYLPAKVSLMQLDAEDYIQLPVCCKELMAKLELIADCPEIIKETKLHIEKNFNKEDFSLLDAAQYMNISPQHLSRIFKRNMGISFVDYLTRVRTRKAMELLHKNEMKMYEIAERVGYSSQHYFSSVFKKEIGVSPVEYRKNCNAQKKRSKAEII